MKAVILAGGSGERFWPISTPEKPKQFLNVFGGESLIRQSVSRLAGVVSPEDIFIITSADLVKATRKELPEVPRKNIVGEPMRRDTGAAVSLGVSVAGEGVIGVFSADQMVMDVKAFRKTLKVAEKAARREDKIVTLGIKPTFPATGFGYINPKSGAFVEKPDLRRAKAYIRKGYLWNAGMFIARSEVFRAAFAKFAPELVDVRVKDYPKLEKISFDYAVMEALSRESGVKVIPCNCGWDDVGSYGAFDKYFPHDSRGNVREGPCTVVEAENNICVARSARISLLGVKDLVVVTTPDYVLVASKDRLGEMKKLFRK